ncbi:GNAT family N-acetyltransferase [Aspergillus brunneoviolaceus CBS 621.78]|uniref:GNAT family acetyltransferase n=1 Tax=Aspergillus brunneoviolaceus CBS 621.78 TaxID=1450534 RepID=A0ACD1GP30_9EURO|nr:GNAT family acetyltransferase [Aspergillus brunneoviolaceus CBS 621.78]RAH50935.1 GNAT family acetyltransferase [Aspergillus brunneoviolaceus CBS 621.78]
MTPLSPPPVPLDIQYTHASDLAALVRVEIRSFPASNYMRSTYKGCDPGAVHTFKTVSALEYFANPECHILAGVLGRTGDIIAYGRWHIPAVYGCERAVGTGLSSDAQAQMRDAWAYAPELVNRGTYSFYEEMITRSRGAHLRETDFVLELLCVLPEYQRMGIGSAFLEWGIEKADACNARIYLEATMEGVPAYLKHGWEVVEEVELDHSERGGEGSQRFALMIREPQGTGLA